MARGRVGLVIIGVISMTAVAVVAGGQTLLDRVLPPAALTALGSVGLGGKVSTAIAPKGEGALASDYLHDTSDGLKADGPIAARGGNEPVFITDAVTGYSTSVGTAIPAEITTIRPILGCALTPPKAGTSVGHVAAGPSGLNLPVVTYNDTHLAAAVQEFVDDYRLGGAGAAQSKAGPAYEAYDVAVTEQREAVYLVLENFAGNRIWNIHPAEGVRIERVVLLGGDQAGVANLDPLVPVEVILNEGLGGCGIRPAYPLTDQQLRATAAVSPDEMPEGPEARRAALTAAVAGYDAWFRASFGVGAAESRVGWSAGTVSLIGPVPGEADPKAAYAPITGAKIRTTQDDFLDIRGQVAEGAAFGERVVAIATGFAYGDLQNLRQGADF